MNRLGTVTHVSGSRKLILRTKVRVRPGTPVVNEDLRPVGKVFDVFGPVNNPYVAVVPAVSDLKTLVGRPLYIVGGS